MMPLSSLIAALGVAEETLGVENLFLRLQSDGSGEVVDWDLSEKDDKRVFVFNTPSALVAWLRSPRVLTGAEMDRILENPEV